MRLLTAFTKGEWSDLTPDEDGEGDDYNDQFRRSLTEFFRSQNLVVLTGLGTSLCIKGTDGSSLAPTMGDLWDAIKERVTSKVFYEICSLVRHSKTADDKWIRDVELLLSKCHLAQEYRASESVSEFIQKAEAVIVEQCDFLEDDSPLDVHESFLRRIGRRPTRHPRTKLFTTNYDLAFETAASRIRFTMVDGFSHTLPQEFDSGYFAYDLVRRDDDGTVPNYIPNVVHLYKLHGSIDWQQNDERLVKQTSPDDPVLIYPRHSCSVETPHLPA